METVYVKKAAGGKLTLTCGETSIADFIGQPGSTELTG